MMLPGSPPRRRGGEPFQQAVDAALGREPLLMDQLQLGHEGGETHATASVTPGAAVRRGAAPADDVLGAQPSNAVARKSARSVGAPVAARPGIGRLGEQRPQPGLVSRRDDVSQPRRHDRADPAADSSSRLSSSCRSSRNRYFAQLDDQRIIRPDAPKGAPIRPQGIAQDVRIPRIIFGARRRKAIAKPIQLLGVHGKDRKALLDQGIDEHPSRRFDRDRDLRRRGAGVRASHCTASCTASAVWATRRRPRNLPAASTRQSACASLPQSTPTNHSNVSDTRCPFSPTVP